MKELSTMTLEEMRTELIYLMRLDKIEQRKERFIQLYQQFSNSSTLVTNVVGGPCRLLYTDDIYESLLVEIINNVGTLKDIGIIPTDFAKMVIRLGEDPLTFYTHEACEEGEGYYPFAEILNKRSLIFVKSIIADIAEIYDVSPDALKVTVDMLDAQHEDKDALCRNLVYILRSGIDSNVELPSIQ